MRQVLILIIVFFCSIIINSQEEQNPTFSEDEILKILINNNCKLAVEKGKASLQLIEKAITRTYYQDGEKESYSPQAFTFCTFVGDDQSLKSIGEKYNNFPEDSRVLEVYLKRMYRVCIDEELYPYYDDIYLRLKPEHVIPLVMVMTKIYIRKLHCSKSTSILGGNIFLEVFYKKLYELADYMIGEIESNLPGYSITLDDITKSEKEKRFLKKLFCSRLKNDSHIIRERSSYYLEKFFGSTNCN